ncbi:MAG: response regulator [Endomicrobiales bacterium]|nr:response regulator [Endomicrobiales bacterium]
MTKILIMDDEPGLRNVVYNVLKPLGHTLFTAEDGHQAIEIAKKEIPDLAMLDIRVPDMDGVEVMAELKKINPNIKAIMLSGFADVETAVSAIKEGAFDYVSKPFKVDEVLKIVNKALQSVSQTSAQPATAKTAETAAASQKTPAEAPAKVTSKEMGKAGGKGIMKTAAFAAAGLLIIVAAGFVIKTGISVKGSMHEYSLPYTNPIGMCFIKPHIWVSDWVIGSIYQHNDDSTLSIVSVYKTNNTQPTGLAFDGESLWTCSSIERRIYKHRMDPTLTVEAIYAIPTANPAGLYFDGANLWVLDTNSAKVYKHKMDDVLSVIGVFDSPAVNPCGMFRSGEYFYIGDYKTSRIYKVLVNDFSVREVYAVPGFEEGKNKLAGITWDGMNIWASCDGIGKVFKISLNSLKPIKF